MEHLGLEVLYCVPRIAMPHIPSDYQSIRLRILNAPLNALLSPDYQMNTHAIGDSANHVVLNTYKEILNNQINRRWRVEHAQVLSTKDAGLFNNIIPSVQPTHAHE